MKLSESDIEKAGLLHDIGKVFQRANRIKKSHAAIGEEILHPYISQERREILHAVAYHHQADLEKAELPADDISYIIYEADNLAAASDRRLSIEYEAKGEEKGVRFVPTVPLHNVFNVFSSETQGSFTAYPLRGIGEKAAMPYPINIADIQAPSAVYQNMARELIQTFTGRSPEIMTVNELLQTMAATMIYIPSSTNTAEVPDVSLYDHQKLTAAFAACLWHVFNERGIGDYKSYCFGNKVKSMRKAPVYLMVSGDMSGIQKFIYTIPSKGALKSLRGRSLYLDVLLEHIIDELLDACQVSRSCLLYSGGGHFYALLPNTRRTISILNQAQSNLNEWFLRHYGNRLYLALAYESCSATDFSKDGNGAGSVFHKVSQKLGKAKLCRYTTEQLQQMFNPHSRYNHLPDASRECAICHMSSTHLRPYGADDEGDEACDVCNGLFRLGQKALKKNIFYISTVSSPDAVPLPGLEREFYLEVIDESELTQREIPRRLYIKNELTLGQQVATTLWVGDYTILDDNGNPVEFAQIAKESGGSHDAKGIERIGILRADVDNLGAAFIAGLPAAYDTLSRKAALSRLLSVFFKRYINDVLKGTVVPGETEFTLFANEKKETRTVHVIYSGGDDMFLAGTWDDIIETAIDLRHAFARFTNDKLTFSAGIGFFNPSFPISQMAQRTGELEDYAKDNPGKNSVTLFGQVVEYGRQCENHRTARYTWDDFEQKVCKEKLRFLESHLSFPGENNTVKIEAGKGVLYRLLSLLRRADEKGRINVARFAYVLARMEPQKQDTRRQPCYQQIRVQLYDWYQSDKDRQELITAIELLIYHMRDKERTMKL